MYVLYFDSGVKGEALEFLHDWKIDFCQVDF